jgi:hypothetical protein
MRRARETKGSRTKKETRRRRERREERRNLLEVALV